jgi:HEAT repeat protein
MVIFDDGNAVLKTLHFEEPTSWLSTQLVRDGDLWNRQWVITQLQARTGDTLAARALADAAVHADYFLTRMQAVDALGHFPSSVAFSAVQAALTDTSAAVRAAAIGAVGRLGGERAAALARSTFAGDSSYQVRAAAVRALVQTDSANARATIAAALQEPSYQDAIRNAALSAITTTNDTSFIGALDQLVGSGSGQTPAIVLARLAGSGNAHARSVLRARLDDERAVVRRWALQAFRFGMSRPAALEQLRAAVDGLTRADAKQAVRDAIQALEAQH